jgi:uncharacterized membrane protein
MTHKILLKFDQQTRAAEVLDQIVVNRLQQIRDSLVNRTTYQNRDVMDALKVLLDWMEDPYAQD